LVQAFLKKWWVESDFKAPNLPLSLRFKGSGTEELAMLSGINSSAAVFAILRQQVKLHKVCVRWVSHCLIGEKQNRVDCAKQLLGKYEYCEQRGLRV
jgi:hypothetical protein